MKDLFDARAELSRLQSRESGLLQELLNIRKAVEAQKAVIEELVRARAIPCIDRLPDELLAQIFLLNRFERESLASVSRRWRAVIMDTPSFWSEIRLELYEECPRLLKLHLERSRQAPLTVSLYYDQPELDVVLLHVNRIRVLRILSSTPDLLDRLASLTFPALEELVDLEFDPANLLLPMYSGAPVLKCLQLERLDESFSTRSLTTRYLDNNSLTRLSLKGISSLQVPRDSIHLPALEFLALRINHPISFLEAIVMPKLKHFEFYNGNPIYEAFCGSTSKFDNVDYLVFAPPVTEPLCQGLLFLTTEICRIFRGVRHASIHTRYLFPFFNDFRRLNHPDHHPSPIRSWTHLESLEIQGFTSIQAQCLDSFMDWLIKRRNVGQQRLHLKLLGEDTSSDCPVIANAPQTLQDYCTSVELYRIRVLECISPRLQVHCCWAHLSSKTARLAKLT
ncbi:hypothetical protein F5141DRAFT_1213002 [Pisolithus sp. B1]|nr:hypothetical protein F5141DRAFT_1213002 [Pisolithus sp. B1]